MYGEGHKTASNSGVIQVKSRTSREISKDCARQFRTMKAEPELYTGGRKGRAELPPLCTVPSWHAEAPIT